MGVFEAYTEKMTAEDFSNQSYLNYSMYTIINRAIPHVADGLKPVHRRILFAMSQLHLDHTAKYKKSARAVGDVLGKYHPHGDSACYEAMVLMAQSFKTRYPLVDGQGNWGSLDDPKSYAAMRYTEAKLTPFAQMLLSDMKANTIDWVKNFDGSLNEPIVLPAQVPLSIINGTTGIAVGMACDIPSHNLSEILEACVLLLNEPDVELESLLTIVKGPDLPTGGKVLLNKVELKKLYHTGIGKYQVRAKYHMEDDKIVITEIPYQVTMSKVIEQIFNVTEEKKLLKAFDDESDEDNPVRMVLTLKDKKLTPEQLMAYLYSKTQLEQTQKFNLNMIGINGKPEVKGLHKILNEWLTYRRDILTRQTQFELDAIEARLHVLAGLMIAYLNIDEVIAVIRQADDPLDELMAAFDLTKIQAQAILDMRLKQLAKLEKIAIEKEIAELDSLRQGKQILLNRPSSMTKHMIGQLRFWQNKFADERRTDIVNESVEVEPDIQTLQKGPASEVTIAISKKGWIKTMKGHDVDVSQTRFKDGDSIDVSFPSMSDKATVVVSQNGRVFNIDNDLFPSANTTGEPLVKHIQLAEGDRPMSYFGHDQGSRVLFATDAGYGFICESENLLTRAKKGKDCLNLYGANAMTPMQVLKGERVALLTKTGKMLVIDESEIKVLSKGKGVKLIGLAAEDSVVGMVVIKDGDELYIQMQGRKSFRLKSNDIEHYLYPRARKGNFVPVRKATLIGLAVKP